MLDRINYGNFGMGRILITNYCLDRASHCVKTCVNFKEFTRIVADPHILVAEDKVSPAHNKEHRSLCKSFQQSAPLHPTVNPSINMNSAEADLKSSIELPNSPMLSNTLCNRDGIH